MPDTASAATARPALGVQPVIEKLLEFDVAWRRFRDLHRRNDLVAELHELYRDLHSEVNRLAMVDLLTGRLVFEGDARAAFEQCLALARASGLQWPDVVEIVNRSGERGQ
ncbi:MAG: hypothetical protein LCH95_13945 [Proteobacteria bacterium]|nr:hypothetical protein [Pseudomonadota bacterium]